MGSFRPLSLSTFFKPSHSIDAHNNRSTLRSVHLPKSLASRICNNILSAMENSVLWTLHAVLYTRMDIHILVARGKRLTGTLTATSTRQQQEPAPVPPTMLVHHTTSAMGPS